MSQARIIFRLLCRLARNYSASSAASSAATTVLLMRSAIRGNSSGSWKLIKSSRALTTDLWRSMNLLQKQMQERRCRLPLMTMTEGKRFYCSNGKVTIPAATATASTATQPTASASGATTPTATTITTQAPTTTATETATTISTTTNTSTTSNTTKANATEATDAATVASAEEASAPTPTQILSRLFPQTSLEYDTDENRERRRREEEEDAEELERAWKRMKISLVFFGIGSIIMSIWSVFYFGRPKVDDDGNEIMDEYSQMPKTEQYVWRTWNSLSRFQKYIQEPSSKKLLPDPLKPPYVQPPYTLVLELKDLLMHPDWTYETGWRFKKRPGVDAFLRECAKYFEIVVFTAEQGMTVFPLLDQLDPNGYIMYRLVRDSTHFFDGHHVKNLNNLNRDLKRVVVIDWDQDATKMHPQNVFNIARWDGNDDDRMLFDLISFLSVLGSSDIDDVREVLSYYRQFDEPILKFRENQKILMEQLEQNETEKKAQSEPIVKKWAHGFMSQMSPVHRRP